MILLANEVRRVVDWIDRRHHKVIVENGQDSRTLTTHCRSSRCVAQREIDGLISFDEDVFGDGHLNGLGSFSRAKGDCTERGRVVTYLIGGAIAGGEVNGDSARAGKRSRYRDGSCYQVFVDTESTASELEVLTAGEGYQVACFVPCWNVGDE